MWSGVQDYCKIFRIEPELIVGFVKNDPTAYHRHKNFSVPQVVEPNYANVH